jgi:Holliday junction resolvase RusA-like endonuclease
MEISQLREAKFVVLQTPKGKTRHSTVPLLRCRKCQRQTMGHHDACPHCGCDHLYFLANTAYTPSEQKEYERFAALCAQQGMQGKEKFVGPTRVECNFLFGIPKSRIKKLRDGDWHTQRPDTDNCVKSIWDAMNQICFADDCVVTQMVASKYWTTGVPRTEVRITTLSSQGSLL